MTIDGQPITVRPRSLTHGRPRSTGNIVCTRCGRSASTARSHLPEGPVCGPCYYRAMRTRGVCPTCGADRLLSGVAADDTPICPPCAGIDYDFHCARCHVEGALYRRGVCARRALREDLTVLLVDPPGAPKPLRRLIDVLCASDRPESIMSWKSSRFAKTLLSALASGEVLLTHAGLDSYQDRRGVEHLRALLVHAEILPPRDPDLARFERWIDDKLTSLPAPVSGPVRRFATWHHLGHIRAVCTRGESAMSAVLAAKQQITETIKFLTWLDQEHGLTAATCTQLDVDVNLASGTTARTAIRVFLAFARKTRINTDVRAGHRAARHRHMITQEHRLAWLR